METIYCISGLGADEKVFNKLVIPGYELKVIQWLQPFPKETLPAYALRMREKITEPEPVLMGLSFGGIMCTEIAKQIPVKKIIIVSSLKHSGELPFWMKAVAKLSLHKIFPLKSTKLTAPFQNRSLGVRSAEDKKLAAFYRKNVNMVYTKWAVNEILNWKNDWVHPNIFHIHGDADNMFPLKYITPDYIIKGGGHFMIMNKADEVGACINEALSINA